MNIRNASLDDMDQILTIYEYARAQMRRCQNPTQWGTDYPQREIIENDIRSQHGYLITEGSIPTGVFAFIIGSDPTYKRIEDGQWLNHAPYGTIHRLAGNGNQRGIFRACLQFCEKKIANIRADTHPCNHIMQHLLEIHGFQKCGRIYVADGSARIAYQRTKDLS